MAVDVGLGLGICALCSIDDPTLSDIQAALTDIQAPSHLPLIPLSLFPSPPPSPPTL